MWKSAKTRNNIAVLDCIFMGPRIGQGFEQWQGSVLDADILAMHHRHQHEMPPVAVLMRDEITINTS